MKYVIQKLVMVLILALGPLNQAYACKTHEAGHHEMQHGFVLADDDQYASHLVATGHHSRQTNVAGVLTIDSPEENEIYNARKSLNTDGQKYFLFQAQKLDLPSLQSGQILSGHIVEAQVGQYEPKNIIIKDAKFKVQKVLLNIKNPFFGDESNK